MSSNVMTFSHIAMLCYDNHYYHREYKYNIFSILAPFTYKKKKKKSIFRFAGTKYKDTPPPQHPKKPQNICCQYPITEVTVQYWAGCFNVVVGWCTFHNCFC